jgi:hypothetical protein
MFSVENMAISDASKRALALDLVCIRQQLMFVWAASSTIKCYWIIKVLLTIYRIVTFSFLQILQEVSLGTNTYTLLNRCLFISQTYSLIF